MLHHPCLGRNKDSKFWMLKYIFNFKSIMWLHKPTLYTFWIMMVIVSSVCAQADSYWLYLMSLCLWSCDLQSSQSESQWLRMMRKHLAIRLAKWCKSLWQCSLKDSAKRVVLPSNFYCGNSVCMRGFVRLSWPWQISIFSWVSAVVLPLFRGDSERAQSVGVCFSVRIQL